MPKLTEFNLVICYSLKPCRNYCDFRWMEIDFLIRDINVSADIELINLILTNETNFNENLIIKIKRNKKKNK